MNIFQKAYARKREAEKNLDLPHVHWSDDVFAGLAVVAFVAIGAIL